MYSWKAGFGEGYFVCEDTVLNLRKAAKIVSK